VTVYERHNYIKNGRGPPQASQTPAAGSTTAATGSTTATSTRTPSCGAWPPPRSSRPSQHICNAFSTRDT